MTSRASNNQDAHSGAEKEQRLRASECFTGARITARLLSALPETEPDPKAFCPVRKETKANAERYSRSEWHAVLYSFRKNPAAVVCLFLLLLIIAASLCASLSPFDPDEMDVLNKMALPGSGGHLLGTDEMGRDELTRVLYGGRVSLTVGVLAMLVSLVVGVLVGTVSGYCGGKTDVLLMRIVDMFQSVPSLLLIIVIYALVPPTMVTLIFMLAMFSWTGVARIVRAETLSIKERDYVLAAKLLGVSHPVIIFRHIIPNMTSQIIVAASLAIAHAILDESALSFLGYGVQLPKSSWGSMLQSAQQWILYDPLLAAIPGVFILLTVLCFNILGDALQQALDPKLNK